MARRPSLRISQLPKTANAPIRKIFVRGLTLDAYVGAYEHEKSAVQPLRFDLEIEVVEPAEPAADRLEDVVCYNRIAQAIKAMLAVEHIKLIETVAERVAEIAMAHPMVLAARVRIEKPRAIAEAEAAGVEIIRRKV